MVKPNGNVMTGQFKDGMLHGPGEIQDMENSTQLKGHFVNNSLFGKGSLKIFNDPSKKSVRSIIEGEFYDNFPHGQVKIVNFNLFAFPAGITKKYADGVPGIDYRSFKSTYKGEVEHGIITG